MTQSWCASIQKLVDLAPLGVGWITVFLVMLVAGIFLGYGSQGSGVCGDGLSPKR